MKKLMVLLFFVIASSGCITEDKSLEPILSDELVGVLQNQGYEVINITTHIYTKKTLKNPNNFLVVPSLLHESDYYKIDTPVREYDLVGEGNASQFIWMAIQLIDIEGKKYPGAHLYVFGTSKFEFYNIPLVFSISRHPKVNGLFIGYGFKFGPDNPKIGKSPYSISDRRSAIGCLNEIPFQEYDISESTKAKLKKLVEETIPYSFSGMCFPIWNPEIAAESKLESYNCNTNDYEIGININYSSPYLLEMDLFDPNGKRVGRNLINYDYTGASDTYKFGIISPPMKGNYELVVKKRNFSDKFSNRQSVYSDDLIECEITESDESIVQGNWTRTYDISFN